MVELLKRAGDFNKDLSSVERGLMSPSSDAEAYRTFFCLEQIEANVTLIQYDLYGAINPSISRFIITLRI